MFTLHATLRHGMRVTGASRAILRAAARPQNSLARSYARQFHPITNRLPLPAAPGTMTNLPAFCVANEAAPTTETPAMRVQLNAPTGIAAVLGRSSGDVPPPTPPLRGHHDPPIPMSIVAALAFGMGVAGCDGDEEDDADAAARAARAAREAACNQMERASIKESTREARRRAKVVLESGISAPV